MSEPFDVPRSAASVHEDVSDDLAPLLGEMRLLPGCPTGPDEAILSMSSPPGHTACPNPFLADWLPEAGDEVGRSDPGPFATDTTAGKTSLVYKAHSYPTKVPHEAIMRFILHYTRPGDVVLDGFCGTGMTGVAAQMCGAANRQLREQVESELGRVEWGARKAVLQDLSPSATFIAAGLNLPVDAGAFDRASERLLKRLDDVWGWMYETSVNENGRPLEAQIDFTIWSEVMTCPHCASEVVFYDVAFDVGSGRVLDAFNCASCGAEVNKDSLQRRLTKVRLLSGDVIDRIEFRPVAIHWRTGKRKGIKVPDAADLDVLRRVATQKLPWFPTAPLPLGEMTHGSRLGPKGFTHVHHLWPDRSLAAIAILWKWIAEEGDPALRRSLRFWVEQSLWGLSWMNRYRPDGYSQVSQYQSGVYYVPSLVSECSVRYNLEGSRPSMGKRQTLVKLWQALRSSADNVRISTGSSTKLTLPDNSVDYVFVDPPFGANIPYADLALVVENWHGVVTAPDEEAIQDDRRHKGLPEYAALMETAIREFHRVLKPGRWMTVEFSNSSNEVWQAIQIALSRAGFVVADTRIFDKEQHSYRQVTAENAVKRDLIISAYKPATEISQRIELAQGSEEGVRAFLAEHLAHLPVKGGQRAAAQSVRERMPDRLYDRMVAYHVAQGIGMPMTTTEFNAALDRWFLLRDGMYFLPQQAEEWERFRITFKELQETELFIIGESSAVQWLRQYLKARPQAFAEIQPAFFDEAQHGSVRWDEMPDLRVLLEQNFIQDDKGRWLLPDPKKAEHLEQLRSRELLRVFESYKSGKRPLDRFRSEAVRAGFKQAWAERDFETIIRVGRRLSAEALAEDQAILHYFRNAERMV